jgi:hypothetical protein
MLPREDKKNRKDWLEYYNKVLIDGYYYVGKDKLMLYDDDRRYIREEIAKIKSEMTIV